jgi:hypothetical protein
MLAPSTTARFIKTEAELGASGVLISANTLTGETATAVLLGCAN